MGYFTRSLPVDAANRHQTAFLEACQTFRAEVSLMQQQDERNPQIFMRKILIEFEYLVNNMDYILRTNITNDGQINAAYNYYREIIGKAKKVIDENFQSEDDISGLRRILEDENENKIQFRMFYNKSELNTGIGLLVASAILFATVIALVILLCSLANAATVATSIWILFYTGFILTNIGYIACFKIGFPKILACSLPPLGSSLIKKIDERQKFLSPPLPSSSFVLGDLAEPNNSSPLIRRGLCGALSACIYGLFHYADRPASPLVTANTLVPARNNLI